MIGQSRYAHTLLFLLLLFANGLASAQGTAISGTINQYASVDDIPASNKLVVSAVSAFATDERVLIIQMQGATIDTTNTSGFGGIIDTGAAGRYEFNTVCSVRGDTLILEYDLTASYNTDGKVQVVSVPQYDDAEVNAELTAAAWDNSSGGVLVLEVNGVLTLNANITVEGLGFQGGDYSPSAAGCDWWATYEDYYDAVANGIGLTKGQGIATFLTNMEGGRGPQGTGGGGGNNHNSGGGGGAHAGAGGQGGNNDEPGTFRCDGFFPGLGGYPISAQSGRSFFGGGGGSGHGNNTDPGSVTSGGTGGGIVIIRADTIIGNGYTINASGTDGGYSMNDGAGGGGAGGTVLLDIPVFDSSSLTVDVSGGEGGDANNDGQNRCFGPGGGGGGGVIQSTAGLPGQVSLDTAGGVAGETINTSSSCSGSLGATDGASGTLLTGVNLSNGSIPGGGCPLLLAISGLDIWIESNGPKSYLKWKLGSLGTIEQFSVECQTPAKVLRTLGSVPAKAKLDTEYTFPLPSLRPVKHYLRIRSIDQEGNINSSHWIAWTPLEGKIPPCDVTPTLLPRSTRATVNINNLNQEVIIESFDASGRRVHFLKTSGNSSKSLAFQQPGIYLIRASSGARLCQSKVIVQP